MLGITFAVVTGKRTRNWEVSRMSEVTMSDDYIGVCEAPDCDAEFVRAKKGRHKRFCSSRCQDRTAKNSKRKGAKVNIDNALSDAHRRDIEQSNRAELKKATALESRIRRYIHVLEEAIAPYESTPLIYEPVSLSGKLPEQELILFVGDWHTGARVKLHETGGVYEQDIATTRAQVELLWDRVQRLHAIKASGVRIKKLHIIGLGDLVDNDDMRPAQHRQVEDVVTVQTVQAFDLWTWLIRQCLTIVDTVEVDMVGGNHDRTGRNRGNAGLGELDYADTFSWLIGEFTKRLFADEPRIKVRNWNTFFGYKHVAGKRVVFEHGSSIKWAANSYGGVPWYGVSTLPVKFAGMLGQSDIFAIGHGHRPALLPNGHGWMVLNGALPATTNYEQSSFKSVHRPLQTLVSMHHEHGLVGWEPIYLDVPGTLMPDDVWEDPEGYAELANRRS